jgi:SAM-dependent methyltransferase
VRRGYLNSRYGYRMRPASLLAGLTWRLRRPAVKNLDYMIRHLPAPGSGGGRVLDAGCGNGDFLRVAEDLGHEAIGIDPDPDAVERARSRGLDARLGHLPGSGLQRGSFDHVFLSHVLEHLHRPAEALSEACALLAPGGRLWLSLPNLEAPGLARFGAGWRGLEPPRHLFLAAPARIIEMLAAAGFEGARLLPAEEGAEVSYRQSLAIASRLDPEGPDEPPGWHEGVAAEAEAANRLARSDPAKGEAVTVVAWRPR